MSENSKLFLSPFTLACAAIGITVGGGVFLLSGVVGKIAGDYLPYLYLAAAIPMFFATFPVVILGGIRPTNAGNYYYASRLLSPSWAFVAIWIFILTACLGQMPLYCFGAADFLIRIFPTLERGQTAFAILFFVFFINIFGFKPVLFLQTLMVVILLASLVFYIIFGFYKFHPKIISTQSYPGIGPLAYGAALLTYTYFGVNSVVELGKEIRNPNKILPYVFFGTFATILVLYTGVAFALSAGFSSEEMRGLSNPVLESAESYFPKEIFPLFILGGPLLAIVTSINGVFLLGTTTLIQVTRDEMLPTALEKRNSHFGTPHYILLLLLFLSLIGISAGFDWELLAAFSALGWTLVFIPLLLGAFRVGKYAIENERITFGFRPWFFVFCVIFGILFQIGFSLLILSNIDPRSGGWIFSVLLFSGIGYYILRKRVLLGRGLDPKRILLSPREFFE